MVHFKVLGFLLWSFWQSQSIKIEGRIDFFCNLKIPVSSKELSGLIFGAKVIVHQNNVQSVPSFYAFFLLANYSQSIKSLPL